MKAQAIKSNNKFSLVQEAYALEDARELLMALVTGTTRFHSLKNIRSWEKKGDKDEVSDKKIKELTELRENILEMLNEVDGDHLSIEINAEIKVTNRNS